jgi:3-oxoacyl-(acyl-carrier-protein) synthase
MMRRVVVTGIGMVTPLGSGVETTWSNLLAGKSGAVRVSEFEVSDLACQIACRSRAATVRTARFNPRPGNGAEGAGARSTIHRLCCGCCRRGNRRFRVEAGNR